MYKKIGHLTSFLFLLSLATPIVNAAISGHQSAEEVQILINNRILAKVNGKAISVLDIMKKMDLIFVREYPELSQSSAAKYQFYSKFWRDMLNNMIDEQLILANAAELKITVSDGDARQELEELFGPNVVLNIDKLGLTFQEALKMIHDELLVKKMDYFMVHSRALNRVGPKEVRTAYEVYAKENPIEATWTYQVVSIRGSNKLNNAAVAQQSFQLLIKDKVPLENLVSVLSAKNLLKEKTTVSISEEYQRTEKSISTQHKDVLETLASGSYSKPIEQVSRAEKTPVFRIFYLKKHTNASVVPLAEVEEKLKAALLDKAIDAESAIYHQKLRHRFGISDDHLSTTIPKDFQPFVLS